MNIKRLQEFWERESGFSLCYVPSTTLLEKILLKCVEDVTNLRLVGFSEFDVNFLQNRSFEQFENDKNLQFSSIDDPSELFPSESARVLLYCSHPKNLAKVKVRLEKRKIPVVVLTRIVLDLALFESFSYFSFHDFFPPFQKCKKFKIENVQVSMTKKAIAAQKHLVQIQDYKKLVSEPATDSQSDAAAHFFEQTSYKKFLTLKLILALVLINLQLFSAF